jgi:hypothetical protein
MHDRLGIGELSCAQPEAFGGSQIVQFGQVEVFVSGPVGNGQDELGSRPAAGAAQHTGQQQPRAIGRLPGGGGVAMHGEVDKRPRLA